MKYGIEENNDKTNRSTLKRTALGIHQGESREVWKRIDSRFFDWDEPSDIQIVLRDIINLLLCSAVIFLIMTSHAQPLQPLEYLFLSQQSKQLLPQYPQEVSFPYFHLQTFPVPSHLHKLS